MKTSLSSRFGKTGNALKSGVVFSGLIFGIICCAETSAGDPQIGDQLIVTPPSCCIDKVEPSAVESHANFVGKWIDLDQRTLLLKSHVLTRHNGARTNLSELVGRPTVLSFVYTRCNNQNKCPAIMGAYVRLRKLLEKSDILQNVNLALVSYDARWDSANTITEYAQEHGLTLDNRTSFYVPELVSVQQLFEDLGVKASINPSGVALHRMQLYVLDSKGRLARTYETILWDNNSVMGDLRRLLEERL